MPNAASPVSRRPRHIPQRTCVSCGTVSAKRQLVRIVRTPGGRVETDPTGKNPGRGAYLCTDPRCWEQAIKKRKLERALKMAIAPEDAAALQAFAAALPAGEAAR